MQDRRLSIKLLPFVYNTVAPIRLSHTSISYHSMAARFVVFARFDTILSIPFSRFLFNLPIRPQKRVITLLICPSSTKAYSDKSRPCASFEEENREDDTEGEAD
jgi:hypothetical protein